ncbi:hypothetical protein D3C86_2199900 [compost metagenome]
MKSGSPLTSGAAGVAAGGGAIGVAGGCAVQATGSEAAMAVTSTRERSGRFIEFGLGRDRIAVGIDAGGRAA